MADANDDNNSNESVLESICKLLFLLCDKNPKDDPSDFVEEAKKFIFPNGDDNDRTKQAKFALVMSAVFWRCDDLSNAQRFNDEAQRAIDEIESTLTKPCARIACDDDVKAAADETARE